MEKQSEKGALENLRMPKVQEIFTTVAIVYHRYERLAVSQNFFRYHSALSKKGR